MARDNFSKTTRTELAKRVNYRCSQCTQQTDGPHTDPRKSVSIGVAAHITAAAEGGPRWNPSLTRKERMSIENGIWMCQSHGKLVDSDESRYTVAGLRAMKEKAEHAARVALERSADQIPPVAADAKPRLRVSRIKQFVLTWFLPIFVPPDPPPVENQWFVCQAWFVNEPADGERIAKAINARITIKKNGEPIHAHPSRGEWALADAADNGAFRKTVSTWQELVPNGDEAKLVIAQKKTEDDDACVWLDGAKKYTRRKHPSYLIAPGDYEVEVRLQAIGVDQTFVFALSNPGAGADLRLSALGNHNRALPSSANP